MNEEQLYIEADKYLLALAKKMDYKILDSEIPSNAQREAIHGILERERAAQCFGNLGFLITQNGYAIICEGGLHKKYKKKKRKEIGTYIGIICGIIAAIASVATLIISLAK